MADVARVLDRFLSLIRSPESVARRIKAKASNANGRMKLRDAIWGRRRPTSSIDYPTPNPYFDSSAINTLRNAYELYKRDDLTSDLLAHLKAEAAKAIEADRTYPLLALGYVEWWNDDKDDAVRDLTLAADAAKGDVELRLGLAELQVKRGEPAEALELVDSVEPLDQKAMQRRELLALRLAVLSGDVERARKASERLFGLRLDADTQIQLAAQMNQLGMHDLAEAVLARARRRAGGNTTALVALMLQYQRQGKTDTAFQVANQILKAGSARTFSPNQNNTDDSAQREAIQVFARSGKLKELIERAETQLKAAPNSVQVLQSLGDYYKAAGDKDKSKATYERLVKLRPDDARLRFPDRQQVRPRRATTQPRSSTTPPRSPRNHRFIPISTGRSSRPTARLASSTNWRSSSTRSTSSSSPTTRGRSSRSSRTCIRTRRRENLASSCSAKPGKRCPTRDPT